MDKFQLNNERGLSLIEALVGVAMIGFVTYVSFNTSTFKGSKVAHSGSCDSVAMSVIESVKAQGVYRQIYHVTPYGADGSGNRNVPLVTPLFNQTVNLGGGTNSLVPEDHLWGALNGDGASEFRVNQTAALGENRAGYAFVNGYMRTLMAIYNSNPGFCNTWTEYPNFTVANLGLNTELHLDTDGDGRVEEDPRIELQVRPYNLDTGANLCPDVLRISPPPIGQKNIFEAAGAGVTWNNGLSTFPQTQATAYNINTVHRLNQNLTSRGSAEAPADRGAQIANYPAGIGSGSDLGIALHVRVTYREDDLDKTCEASQTFQYFPDTSRPAQPSVEILSNTSMAADFGWGGTMTSGPRTLSLRINYAGTENGIQLYCRDRSEMMNFQPRYGGNTEISTPCYDGGFFTDLTSRGDTPSKATGVPNNNGRTTIAGLSQAWIPCDQVTVCGETPSSVVADTNTDVPNVRYDLTYTIPPTRFGCDVIVDAIAVDAAGNRSDLQGDLNNSTLSTNPFNFIGTAGDFTGAGVSVVRRPRCSRFETSPGGATRGFLTEFGFWCRPTDWSNPNPDNAPPDIPHWSGPYSTSPSGNWINEFPNGYYTTGNGCCYNPPNGSVGTCTPR